MELKWIKMDTGMFGTNRAIRQIEGMADGDSLLVIWFKLLLLAGRTGEGGRIELIPGIPTTPEMLAVELARPIEAVTRALSVFSAFGMLDTEEMRVVGFAASQGGKSPDARGVAADADTARSAPSASAEKSAEAAPSANEAPRASEEGSPTPTEKTDAAPTPTEKTPSDATRPFARERKTREEQLLDRYEEEQKKRTFLGGTLGGGVLLLSPAQLDDLVERLSLEELERYAGVVVECEKSGKRFTKRTHYDAILEMAEKDRRIAPRPHSG